MPILKHTFKSDRPDFGFHLSAFFDFHVWLFLSSCVSLHNCISVFILIHVCRRMCLEVILANALPINYLLISFSPRSWSEPMYLMDNTVRILVRQMCGKISAKFMSRDKRPFCTPHLTGFGYAAENCSWCRKPQPLPSMYAALCLSLDACLYRSQAKTKSASLTGLLQPGWGYCWIILISCTSWVVADVKTVLPLHLDI
jgi:hypothetical protein